MEWPDKVKNEGAAQVFEKIEAKKIAVTYINHSTFLWQLPELNVLTDPVYSRRVSPLSWSGPKRVREPGLAFEKLPPIDVVIISHNHYDHLDIKTLKKLEEKFSPVFLVPLGDAVWLRSEGLQKVIELDWWESHEVKGVEIHFTPAQHFSGRGLFDRDLSLWGSFLLKTNEMKIYFGGDTGYASHFEEIGKRFGGVDLAFLPIGAYEPRWFMKMAHVNPEEAVQAHIDLQARLSIGMHFGTFQLTDEAFREPPSELAKGLTRKGVPLNHFRVMPNGQTWEIGVEQKKLQIINDPEGLIESGKK